jgi:hypothetical protein
MRHKHVPHRTCIGCRQQKAKRELVRLVRTPDGQLVVDATGKQNGRGAYLCRQKACCEAALKGNQIGRALKMDVGQAELESIRGFVDTL